MQPNKADEALQLFAALQDELQLETRKRDANRAARVASAEPLLRASWRQSGDVRRAATSGPLLVPLPSSASSSQQPPSSVAGLQRKLQVADDIMRRLHAKNQKLLQCLAAVRRAEEDVAEGTVKQLREKLQQREKEVRQLRHRLHESEQKAEGSSGGAAIALLTLRVRQMEKQYNRLLEAKLTDTLKESSVKGIDTEVRELFMLMKNRIIADARHHEAEVLLLNEALLEAERRLATVPGAGAGSGA
ncbi:hypothetical protein TraAM80_06638 [Trypanosoma rangeli]|uniref:Uncharacterized protein n=1 Tax=Trypanosoma rangeli TaxID=5698 RepID=A0A422N9A1_TRYRA|nr:uncharacterized protein TraAM80_06638 [Trypanosoma rangeli]RNF02023.1 hypothetical protein TraAM80_06638 [Trypanosoma rangeli]|eukprot:RNF02023.1 hypothetical protein TraAM80_06638 [Trypanosoma rangeli]